MLAQILEQTGGKFFGVTFEKKDGSIREMQARTGVRKGVKGVQTEKPAGLADYITVYDVQNAGFRNIHRDKILSIRFQGLELYKRQK